MEQQESSNYGFFSAAIGIVVGAWRAIMRDGHLSAAGRQGINEIGMALKAFPESIQAYEAGTIFSPTQGEIATAREIDGPSPGDIARDDTPCRVDPDQTYNHELGRGR